MAVVLVTGASSGIGQECMTLLIRAGHRVYGTSRSGVAVPPRSEARDGNGESARLFRMELTDEDSVRAVVEFIRVREGRLDAVVNNAGFGLAGAIEDTSISEARSQLEVNFLGAVRVCREVLPLMREQGSGCIVNIGSMAGLIGVPFQAFYSASKFALEGFTSALRLEVRRYGIRVVLIRPGDLRTAFTENRVRTLAWMTSPYRKAAEAALERMEADECRGASPELVGRLVVQIVEARARRPSYTVGTLPQRVLLALGHLLPEDITSRITARYYAI